MDRQNQWINTWINKYVKPEPSDTPATKADATKNKVNTKTEAYW